ncbi:MAG TPA: ABC transporter substrate-binding protein [Chloroflexota bacterium]|nr:ABC transporter substrate-binding protein [Chloroflexota bacterium]
MRRLSVLGCVLIAMLACGAPAASPPPSSAPPAAGSAPGAPAAAATAPPRERVTILYPNQGGNQTATWLAKEAGLYDKYGLDADVEFIEGSPTVMQAVTAGNAQFAVVGTTASIAAAFRGLDAVLIATAQPGLLYTLWSSSISQVGDLRGKRVATGRINTDPDFALRLLLDKLGLVYNQDVTAVHVDAGGESGRIAVAQAGGADAVMLTTGNSGLMRRLGFAPLVDLVSEHIPYEAATVATTRSYAASKPHAVRAFTRAFTEAIALAKQDRAAVLDLYKTYARLEDAEVAGEWYDEYVQRVFPRAPYVSEAGVQTVLDLLAETEPQAADAKPSQFIDNSYVRELDDSGFIRQLYPNQP